MASGVTDDGENWFLILVLCILSVLFLIASIYILVNFLHPEDRVQAWLPKIVVVLGLVMAMLSVVLLPLDVANRASCAKDVPLSSCSFSLPMKELWSAIYMIIFIMLIFIIPTLMAYYESDSEDSPKKRAMTAAMYELAVLFAAGLIVGLAYGFAGFIELEFDVLESGLGTFSEMEGRNTCFNGSPCTVKGNSVSKETVNSRVRFSVYVVALMALAGWFLLVFYGGVGLIALPFDAIKSFLTRPKKTITRTQYVTGAKRLAKKAQELKQRAEEIRKEEREIGKTRKTRRETSALEKEIAELEESDRVLQEAFPQGEDPTAAWIWTVVRYYVQFFVGILGLSTTILWLLHMVLFMFTPLLPTKEPIDPFLNTLLIDLDQAFPLFGTTAFAAFCLHMLFSAIKGNFVLGMSFLLIEAFPMQLNGTFMGSFLFNLGFILLTDVAVIQLCAQAFAVYANDTTVNTLFTAQLSRLQGMGVLFRKRVFIVAIFSVAILSGALVPVRRMKHKKRDRNEAVE